MLSKPAEWNFSHKALLAELPFDKKGTIQTSINKLVSLGYLKITQERKKGKLGKTVWYVYDTPHPDIRDTVRDAPHPEIPDSGKSTSYKKESIKKKAAVSAVEGGAQLMERYYLDPVSGGWREKT